jgi:excisionase family DNA binding protein
MQLSNQKHGDDDMALAKQPTEKQAFTIKEFCAAYGVRRTFVYEEIKAGKLETRAVGTRKVLIRRSDAEAWMNSKPVNRPKTLAERISDALAEGDENTAADLELMRKMGLA